MPSSTLRVKMDKLCVPEYLDKIGGMCGQVSASSQLEELLGSEIAECILWRRGALLYMYCSTIQEDGARLQRQLEEYREVIGVSGLYQKRQLWPFGLAQKQLLLVQIQFYWSRHSVTGPDTVLLVQFLHWPVTL